MAVWNAVAESSVPLFSGEKLIRVHVVAHRLNLSPRMVRHLIGTGELPASRIGQRAWGVTPSDLDRYMLKREWMI